MPTSNTEELGRFLKCTVIGRGVFGPCACWLSVCRSKSSSLGGDHQWRIQDFSQGGAPTPKIAIIFQIFAKNCMKMKEFGPPGGARAPGAPLDLPMTMSPCCH